MPQVAGAQLDAPPPTFYTTYRYTAYTVYDNTATEPPTRVRGVGGSLTLRPAGTSEKRLSIAGPNGPMYFRQDGTFTLRGDSIRFAFSDLKGPDVQRGTFRFSPATQRLTLTIFGYPAGNKGVYELVVTDSTPAPGRSVPAPKDKNAKRHR
ncbi:MAG: hypothetical protein NVSMB30_23000 [Hymenobacter sp.]